MESPVLYITINSTYFLGIIASTMCGMWYFGRKMSKIEITVGYIEKDVDEIKRDVVHITERLSERKYGQRSLENLYKNKQ